MKNKYTYKMMEQAKGLTEVKENQQKAAFAGSRQLVKDALYLDSINRSK